MRNDVLYLVTTAYDLDDYGVEQITEKEKKVFCDVSSISSNEYFRGEENGNKPQYRFTIFSHEYNDESIVRYRGVKYGVYRTYQTRPDTIELYVEEKQGVTN